MRLIGIVIALVLAVAAGYIYFSLSQPQAPAPEAQFTPSDPMPVTQTVQSVQVLVASQPIAIGEVLKPEQISRQPWPSHLVLDGFITVGDGSTNSATNIVGMVTRATFQEGEPIILSKLSNPADPNFLAAAIRQGYKVATIQVDNISAVAGFLYPGDYVDVLVTHDLPVVDTLSAGTGVEKKESFTELLVSNIKVLAVDDRSTAGQDDTTDGQKRPPSSVSLEVTLEQAQKLRLAQETGYLSLALRSLKDKDVEETLSPTSVSDLTRTTGEETNMNGASMPVRVVRGTETEDTAAPQTGAGYPVAPTTGAGRR
jgi:pilus assembly protein CpaB